MMVTIIIIAVLMVFSFSLILISYNLYASQNKNISSQRNAEAANSLSVALGEELTAKDAGLKSNLWNYLRFNIAYIDPTGQWADWPYYAPDEEGHGEKEAFRYFKLDSNPNVEGIPAQVSVCMYWELPKNVAASQLAAEDDDNSLRSGIILHVQIDCMTAGQSYRVSDSYRLSVYDWEADDTNLKASLNAIGQGITLGHMINNSEKWEWKYEENR